MNAIMTEQGRSRRATNSPDLNSRQYRFLGREALEFASQDDEWDHLSGKRIAVSGSTGMLGSWVVLLLSALNEVRGSDKSLIYPLISPDSKQPLLWKETIDATNVYEWSPEMPTSALPEAEVYFHLASPAAPAFHTASPTANFDANINGTQRMLERARSVTDSRLVFASSGEVYGLTEGLLTEATVGSVPLGEPRWAYAESKRAAEALCAAHLAEFGTDFVVARLFHSFGPGIRPGDGRIFGDIIESVVMQEPIRLRNSEDVQRPFCYAADAARGLLTLASNGKRGEAYNIAGSEPISLWLLAHEVSQQFQPMVKFPIKPCESAPNEASNPSRVLRPSIAKAASLGWRPLIDPLDAFGRTIAFLRLGGA